MSIAVKTSIYLAISPEMNEDLMVSSLRIGVDFMIQKEAYMRVRILKCPVAPTSMIISMLNR